MSVSLTIDMPESVFSAIRKSPSEFAAEMRLAAAVKWYEMGVVSQEKAAEIAGLTRADFIFSLARFGEAAGSHLHMSRFFLRNPP